jgi:hypothetical protein
MHEYIRETSSTWKYNVCNCCDYRTPFTCVRCGYCWSCHWKKERLEKNELLKNRFGRNERLQKTNMLINSNTMISKVSPVQQQQQIEQEQEQKHNLSQIKMINVFGEEVTDPICNYLNCNHAFSMHKISNAHHNGCCSCRHPQNSIIGIK